MNRVHVVVQNRTDACVHTAKPAITQLQFSGCVNKDIELAMKSDGFAGERERQRKDCEDRGGGGWERRQQV